MTLDRSSCVWYNGGSAQKMSIADDVIREYRTAQKFKKRAEVRAAAAERIKALTDEIHQRLGNRCAQPGCEWMGRDALQIDHVQGDGARHRRAFQFFDGHLRRRLSRGRYYQDILDAINRGEAHRFQLLCANHNWLKYRQRDRRA